MEQFKAVQGYEDYYQVSNLGRVKSLPRMRTWGNRTYLTQERFLKAHVHHTGYYVIVLCVNGTMRTEAVHLLVIRAFHPKEEGRSFANHKDRNPLNNCSDNLEWVNRRENTMHSTQLTGTICKYPYVSQADNKTNPFKGRIKVNGKPVNLGCFATAKLAYEAVVVFMKDNNIVNKYSEYGNI